MVIVTDDGDWWWWLWLWWWWVLVAVTVMMVTDDGDCGDGDCDCHDGDCHDGDYGDCDEGDCDWWCWWRWLWWWWLWLWWWGLWWWWLMMVIATVMMVTDDGDCDCDDGDWWWGLWWWWLLMVMVTVMMVTVMMVTDDGDCDWWWWWLMMVIATVMMVTNDGDCDWWWWSLMMVIVTVMMVIDDGNCDDGDCDDGDGGCGDVVVMMVIVTVMMWLMMVTCDGGCGDVVVNNDGDCDCDDGDWWWWLWLWWWWLVMVVVVMWLWMMMVIVTVMMVTDDGFCGCDVPVCRDHHSSEVQQWLQASAFLFSWQVWLQPFFCSVPVMLWISLTTSVVFQLCLCVASRSWTHHQHERETFCDQTPSQRIECLEQSLQVQESLTSTSCAFDGSKLVYFNINEFISDGPPWLDSRCTDPHPSWAAHLRATERRRRMMKTWIQLKRRRDRRTSVLVWRPVRTYTFSPNEDFCCFLYSCV